MIAHVGPCHMTYPPPSARPAPAASIALSQALRDLALAPSIIDRAEEIAAIVRDLTGDESLAQAALLHATLGGPPARDAEHAAVREAAGTAAPKLAQALARLGEFGLDEHWAREQALAPTQAETLRKMLLAVVGDARLVVARLAMQ